MSDNDRQTSAAVFPDVCWYDRPERSTSSSIGVELRALREALLRPLEIDLQPECVT